MGSLPLHFFRDGACAVQMRILLITNTDLLRYLKKNNCYMHAISDGPYRNEEYIIESTYKQIINSAKKYVVYIMIAES